jgi:hypothetical protein
LSHVFGGFSQMGGEEPGGEDTGIPDEAWPSHEPTSPFIKNTTRNLQFNESHFHRFSGCSRWGDDLCHA